MAAHSLGRLLIVALACQLAALCFVPERRQANLAGVQCAEAPEGVSRAAGEQAIRHEKQPDRGNQQGEQKQANQAQSENQQDDRLPSLAPSGRIQDLARKQAQQEGKEARRFLVSTPRAFNQHAASLAPTTERGCEQLTPPPPPLARKLKGHSLRNVLTSAKNLLAGRLASIERASDALLSHGSNLLAALIPLLSLLLPTANGGGRLLTTSGASNQQKQNDILANKSAPITPFEAQSNSSSSLFWAQTNAKRSSTNAAGSLQARVEFLMGWLERSIEHLPNFPRLHPQECVKRSICEAHNDPNKYGALGFLLRLLFPASSTPTSGGAATPIGGDASGQLADSMMEYKVINKYRHAAGFGLSKRLDNNGASNANVCRDKYEDCLVSLLEVAKNLVDLFVR